MVGQTKVRADYPPWLVKSSRWLLDKLGWEIGGARPEVGKTVVTTYPHDTNWDLPYSILTAFALRLPVVFTMKKEWFFWPVGPVFRWLGGIPIDRNKASNLVGQIVKEYEKHDVMHLMIPPEGTRGKVDYWKMGFYWIALGAKVPVLPGYVDYKGKRAGVGEPIFMTGDVEEDFEKIRAFYISKVGKCGELPPKYREGKKPATAAETVVPAATEVVAP